LSSTTVSSQQQKRKLSSAAETDHGVSASKYSSGYSNSQTSKHNTPVSSDIGNHATATTSNDHTSSDSESVTAKSEKVFRGFLDSVNSKEQAELDLLFAEACYTAGWSFNCVSNPFVKDFLQKIRPGWHPPPAHQLTNKLHIATTTKVDDILNAAISNAANLILQLNVTFFADRPRGPFLT